MEKEKVEEQLTAVEVRFIPRFIDVVNLMATYVNVWILKLKRQHMVNMLNLD